MLSKCNKVLESVGRGHPETCEGCTLGRCKEGYDEELRPDILALADNCEAFFEAHPEIAEVFVAWQAARVGRWLGESM